MIQNDIYEGGKIELVKLMKGEEWKKGVNIERNFEIFDNVMKGNDFEIEKDVEERIGRD